MNLLINPNPKNDTSVGVALARRLGEQLPGDVDELRLYDEPHDFFQFEHNLDWIDRVTNAERIVIPVPMWNFSVPAALKNFIDKIMKVGVTFKVEGGEYVGLLDDRPAYIIMTSGGKYADDSPNDFVVPYLRYILSAIGIKDIHVYRLGHVAKSAELVQDHDYLDEQTKSMLSSFEL